MRRSALLGLIEGGRAWVKRSGFYTCRMSAAGHPGYPEVVKLAREFPDRCLWASDSPHVSEPTLLPDDDELIASFNEWIGDEALRTRIVVDNPARLYGFAHGDTLNKRGSM